MNNTKNNINSTSKVTAIVSANALNGEITNESLVEIAKSLLKDLSLDNKNQSPEQRETIILRRKLLCNALGISAKTEDQFLRDLQSFIASNGQTEKPNYLAILERENNAKIDKGVSTTLNVASKIIPELNVVKIAYSGLKFVISGMQNEKSNSAEEIVKTEALKIFMEKFATLNSILDKEIAEISENKKTMNPKEFSAYKKKKIAEIREKMEKAYNIKIGVEEEQISETEKEQ